MRPLVIGSALAAALTGCGQKEVDAGKAEGFVRSTFNPPARSVNCPEGVDVEKGKTFDCTAVDAGGRRFRVTVHIIDDEGRVGVSPTDRRLLP